MFLKKFRTINLLVLITFVPSISVGVYAQEEERPDFSLIEYKSGKQQSFQDILISQAEEIMYGKREGEGRRKGIGRSIGCNRERCPRSKKNDGVREYG